MQACGSGGTTAGVALGNHLSKGGARVHAFGVCDDPDYFYDYIDGLFQGLGATREAVGKLPSAQDALAGNARMVSLSDHHITYPVSVMSGREHVH